jgi:hypothetical protein
MARKKVGIADVAKRFGITAREARDIATAVGTAAQNVRGGAFKPGTAGKIIKKQVKETVTAARTGKKGTTSPTLKPTGKKIDVGGPGKPISNRPQMKYEKGKKRK